MQDEVLATITASPIRRKMGLLVLFVLGGLLVGLGFKYPASEFGWKLFLLGLGGVVLYLAEKMRRATMITLELTETELRDSTGTVLARVEDIVEVVRGSFAMKPSHGFSVRTRNAMGRRWLPGLWWRVGRRVGIGGVTPSSQTKVMSEILALKVAQARDPNQDA